MASKTKPVQLERSIKWDGRARHWRTVYFGFWQQRLGAITHSASVVWPCSLPASQETRCTALALPFLFPTPVFIHAAHRLTDTEPEQIIEISSKSPKMCITTHHLKWSRPHKFASRQRICSFINLFQWKWNGRNATLTRNGWSCLVKISTAWYSFYRLSSVCTAHKKKALDWCELHRLQTHTTSSSAAVPQHKAEPIKTLGRGARKTSGLHMWMGWAAV